MSTKFTLLCAAQQFGFGPMAELNAIVGVLRHRLLPNVLQIAIHNEPALKSLNIPSSFACEVLPSQSANELKLSRLATAIKGRGAIFSSYDSEAVFTGWFHGLPTYLYDGLAWFWNWCNYDDILESELSYLEDLRQRQDSQEFFKAFHRLRSCDYHLTVLIAYHLATAVYVRRGTGLITQLERFSKLRGVVTHVGAVMDTSASSAPEEIRSHILVSLSGSLAPLISFEQNLVFARGALKFAIEGHSIFDRTHPWFFVCHPAIYQELAREELLLNLPHGFTVVPSFSYKENLRMIGNAHAMFASPGFSSVQEAAMLRTPLFFLPEQNGGQPKQFLMLRDAGYDASCNWTATDKIYGGKCKIGENDVDRLYQDISNLWSPDRVGERRKILRKFLHLVEDTEARKQLINSQVSATSQVFGDFDGANRIADGLRTAIQNHQSVTDKHNIYITNAGG